MTRRVFVLALVIVASASLGAQVSFDRILRAQSEPQNWLTYSGKLRAIATASSRRSRRPTSRTSSCNGCFRRCRSRSSKRRRWRRRRALHRAGRRTTSWRSTPHRADVLDLSPTRRRRRLARAAAASIAGWRFSATRCSWATIDGRLSRSMPRAAASCGTSPSLAPAEAATPSPWRRSS